MDSVHAGASRLVRRETFSGVLDFVIHLAVFILVAFAFLHLFALESGGKSKGLRIGSEQAR